MLNLRKKLRNKLFSYLFCLPDPSKAIEIGRDRLGKGFVVLGGKRLTDDDARVYVSEAKAIKELTIHKRIVASFRHGAAERLFNKSKNEDDILANKMVLWTLHELESALDELSKVDVSLRKKK